MYAVAVGDFDALGYNEMCLEFFQRPLRDLQELNVRSSILSTVSLGNIGGDRGGGSSSLTGQPINFFLRPGSRQCVNCDGEVDSLLPDDQIPV